MLILSLPLRYRPLKANKEELKDIIDEFLECQDYEKTYNRLAEGEWMPKTLRFLKGKLQHDRLKEHVSIFLKSVPSPVIRSTDKQTSLQFTDLQILAGFR